MEKTILNMQGRKFVLEPMAADEAALFGLEVMQIVAGPIQMMLASDISLVDLMKIKDGEEGETSGDDESMMKLVAAFMSAIPRLDMAKVARLMRQAMSGSVTLGSGERLSDQTVKDMYFEKHPGDYYPVGLWAAWNLSKDFLLGAIPGIKEVFHGVAPQQSQSQSPKSGPLTTSSGQSSKLGSAPLRTLGANE